MLRADVLPPEVMNAPAEVRGEGRLRLEGDHQGDGESDEGEDDRDDVKAGLDLVEAREVSASFFPLEIPGDLTSPGLMGEIRGRVIYVPPGYRGERVIVGSDTLTAEGDRSDAWDGATDNLIASSPLYFAERLPLAQVHWGLEDTNVPVINGEACLARYGRARGQGPCLSVRFHPGAGHDQDRQLAPIQAREFLLALRRLHGSQPLPRRARHMYIGTGPVTSSGSARTPR